MPIARPLTKELLKKLFLKTRHEVRRGGKLDGHSSSVGGVIGYIPQIFPELGPHLTNEEKYLAVRAAFELERDGFIWQEIGQSEAFKVLSDLGEEVVERDLADMRLPSIDLDQLLSRDDLRGLTRDDFNSGDYETAVFKAFRHLEEYVRFKAKEPASSLGVALMSAAFSQSNGKLKHPAAAVSTEQEGLHQLMRGAIAWFKNPSSHRTVRRDDAQQAAHVLAFANMLLDLVDECK
ncbi:TIGR02391 family protein [Gemmata sp.]|uniref:TIGR02391 family protein n=1 Tax=Gemmata sp. TaxID=1914242 RepID=UPI003F6E45BB